ncbi:unnamed protein product [Oreochromis niloticus]|nr:unnamed protein product [Mustela putorius furo]
MSSGPPEVTYCQVAIKPQRKAGRRTGVCVLLLSAPTVSAVSLSVSPNLQQVFSGSSSVYLSCVDDGQTADGWTVKRTRGGLTEDCGAAAGFGRLLGSSCVLDRSVSSDGSYFCENSSGQQSDEVSISVSGTDSQMFQLCLCADVSRGWM